MTNNFSLVKKNIPNQQTKTVYVWTKLTVFHEKCRSMKKNEKKTVLGKMQFGQNVTTSLILYLNISQRDVWSMVHACKAGTNVNHDTFLFLKQKEL